MQAKLIFMQLEKAETQIEEPTKLPVPPPKKQSQTPEQSKPVESVKIERPAPKHKIETEAAPTQQTPMPTPSSKPEPVITKAKPPSPKANINTEFTGTAGKHVELYNQQQDAQMAVEASQYFQQQKNGAIIQAPNKDRFVSAEEKLLNKTKIRANCDGMGRIVSAAILRLMGGNVECTRNPKIDGFIQKRINKEHHLDGKYKPPLAQYPKSVVIQD